MASESGDDNLVLDYGFRIYNPAVARFLSTDPLTRGYPMLTPYQFASNSPIANSDLDGLEAKIEIYARSFEDNQPMLELVLSYELEEEGIYGSGILQVIHNVEPVKRSTYTDFDQNSRYAVEVFEKELIYRETDDDGNTTGFKVTELEEITTDEHPIYYGGNPGNGLVDPLPVGRALRLPKLLRGLNFTKKAPSYVKAVKISKTANDWARKGAHVHVGKVEIAIKPGDKGSIVLKQFFSGTGKYAPNAKEVAKAFKEVELALTNRKFLIELRNKSAGVRDTLKSGNKLERAKSGELNFLIKSLNKLLSG